MLVRSLADCSNKFEKHVQDASNKKGELVILLRLYRFLCQLEVLELFSDILYKYWPTIAVEVQRTLIKMLDWLIIGMLFFCIHRSLYCLEFYLFLLDQPHAAINGYFIMFFFQIFCSCNYLFKFCFRYVFQREIICTNMQYVQRKVKVSFR